MATELNIYEKLAKIREAVEVIQRDKQGYGYRYVSDSEILAKLTGLLKRYGLSLIPEIDHDTLQVIPYTYQKMKYDKQSKSFVPENCNEILVYAEMTYTWVDNLYPDERIVIPWVLVGQQSDASQSFGSGLTYSYRYFLLKYFGIATPDDDPDAWRSKQRTAEKEQDRLVTSETLEELDRNIRAFLEQNPARAGDVKQFITGYVKSGDYWKITEPKVAIKLLSDFGANFVMGGNN